jgi:hypothetical protein
MRIVPMVRWSRTHLRAGGIGLGQYSGDPFAEERNALCQPQRRHRRTPPATTQGMLVRGGELRWLVRCIWKRLATKPPTIAHRAVEQRPAATAAAQPSSHAVKTLTAAVTGTGARVTQNERSR